METHIKGNPGHNNTYQESKIENVETINYNPTIYQQCATTRLSNYFIRLTEEVSSNTRAPIKEELMEYTTHFDADMDLEQKLYQCGHKPSRIQDAKQVMEMFIKKLKNYACYPSAQNIILLLMARIKNEFNTNIYPLIEHGTPLRTIMAQIRSRIVLPIMDTLNADGAFDEHLCFTEDHIYGMLYYLTGMGYISWIKEPEILKICS